MIWILNNFLVTADTNMTATINNLVHSLPYGPNFRMKRLLARMGLRRAHKHTGVWLPWKKWGKGNEFIFYLCDSWENSSSDSSSSWLTFTNGIGLLEVSVGAPIPVLKVPPAISSWRSSTLCKVSFKASPWQRSSSSLEEKTISSKNLHCRF